MLEATPSAKNIFLRQCNVCCSVCSNFGHRHAFAAVSECEIRDGIWCVTQIHYEGDEMRTQHRRGSCDHTFRVTVSKEFRVIASVGLDGVSDGTRASAMFVKLKQTSAMPFNFHYFQKDTCLSTDRCSVCQKYSISYLLPLGDNDTTVHDP